MALDKFQPYLFVSSGEQSNKLLTPTYADGIAQFQAQRAQSLTGLTVRIGPIQEGTGDPSPTNIRPISGRTGMTVTRAGRNIAQLNNLTVPSGADIQAPVSDYMTLAAGTYTLSYTLSATVTATRNRPFYRTQGGIVSFGSDIKTAGRGSWTFTLTEETNLRFEWWYHTVSSAVTLSDFMLEFGDTAHEYAPYVAPTTYPITWQTEAGTVYGGTLDVVSGVLTVTHAVAELDENWYWYKGSSQPTGKSVISTTQSPGVVDAMSHYKYANTNYIVQMGAFTYFPNPTSANTLYVCASDTDSMTVADFKDYIVAQRTAGTPIQIYYRLATLQTYRLTGEDVRTIAGFNQIYSDAGPVIDIKF